MSAFIVTKATIDIIVTLWRYRARWLVGEAPTLAACEQVGRMLWTENHASVSYRHQETNDASEIEAYTFEFAELPDVIADAVPRALGVLCCYEYQSCEHPAWDRSGARWISQSLITWLTGIAPGAKREAGEARSASDLMPRKAPTVCADCNRQECACASTDPLTRFVLSLGKPLDRKGGDTCNDVRKRIRVDLAKAVKAKILPAGTKFSVTGDYNSVRVDITAWEGPVLRQEYEVSLMDPKSKFDDEAIRQERRDAWLSGGKRARQSHDTRLADQLVDALVTVEEIADRHNYNNSRIEEDYHSVGYYLTVHADTVMHARERGIQVESSKPFSDLANKAHTCAQVMGANVVRAILGKGGFDTAGEWALAELVRLAIHTGCVTYTVNGKPATIGKCYGSPVIEGEVAPVSNPPTLVYNKSRRRWMADKKEVS